MNTTLRIGDQVFLPWGLAQVRGTVVEVYGPIERSHVVVELTPELSGEIVDETTTVSLPLAEVRPVPAAV